LAQGGNAEVDDEDEDETEEWTFVGADAEAEDLNPKAVLARTALNVDASARGRALGNRVMSGGLHGAGAVDREIRG